MTKWLGEGRTELLRLLVDPMSGQSLGDVMADWENFLEDASDLENREEMIAERLGEEVNEPVSKSWEIHEPTEFTDEIL